MATWKCPICGRSIEERYSNTRRHYAACRKANNGFASLQEAGEWLVGHGYLSENLVHWTHYGTGRVVELVHCQRGYVKLIAEEEDVLTLDLDPDVLAEHR